MGASAQVEKGSCLLGAFGTASRNSSLANADDVSRNNVFNAGMRMGKMMTGKFMAGALVELYSNSVSWNTPGNPLGTSEHFEQRGLMFSAGLFGRYFQNIGETKFSFFAQSGITCGRGTITEHRKINSVFPPGQEEHFYSKTSELKLIVQPGIAYFFSKHLAVESFFGNLGAVYRAEVKVDQKNRPAGNYTSVNINNSVRYTLYDIYLGVNFYF
jgi:hypothetical protein